MAIEMNELLTPAFSTDQLKYILLMANKNIIEQSETNFLSSRLLLSIFTISTELNISTSYHLHSIMRNSTSSTSNCQRSVFHSIITEEGKFVDLLKLTQLWVNESIEICIEIPLQMHDRNWAHAIKLGNQSTETAMDYLGMLHLYYNLKLKQLLKYLWSK